jgi:ATP-dependent helicase HrpA
MALPRTAKAFDALLGRGKTRLEASARDVGAVYGAAVKELEKATLAMRSAEKHPSATLCLRDLRAQVARLVSLDVVSRASLADLGHYPRYLRAAQARLGRAISDPRKDLAKGEPLVAVERALSDTRALARRPADYVAVVLDAEELRVAVFAPELRPSRAVSPADLTRRAAALLA